MCIRDRFKTAQHVTKTVIICTATVTHCHHHHPQGHAMLISSLVVTYLHSGGVKGRAFLKQHPAPLQSYLHERLVNSITALGSGELKDEAKLSLG